jgi:FKBP12-rapamycin complex-associated protein
MPSELNFAGHEDLRQDERVMQLFSLVNNLLSVDTASFKRRLHIQRYPVIPLAPNAGLLGWVQDSDTLHVLVRDHREARKVVLNIEYRMMIQVWKMFLLCCLLTARLDGSGLRKSDLTAKDRGV